MAAKPKLATKVSENDRVRFVDSGEGQRKRRESEREVPSYRHQLNRGSIDAAEACRHNHYRFEACTAAGTTLTPHERRFAE